MRDMVSRVRELLGIAQTPQITLAEPAPLPGSLPTELWQLISSFLPISSQAALCLTSRQFYHTLDTRCRKRLRDDPEECRSFLKLLDSQLPKHVLCYECLTYHKRTAMQQRLTEKHSPGLVLFMCKMTYLRFSDVQLAMRQERLGPKYGKSVPSFQSSLRRAGVTIPSTYSYSFEAVPVNGRLLFRLDVKRPILAHTNLRRSLGFRINMGMCEHYYVELSRLIRCAHAHVAAFHENGAKSIVANGHCDDCMVIQRRPTCPSEYTIKITPTDKNLNEFVVHLTRWADAGDGTDPHEGAWKALLQKDDAPASDNSEWLTLPSVRHRFEMSKGRYYEPSPKYRSIFSRGEMVRGLRYLLSPYLRRW